MLTTNSPDIPSLSSWIVEVGIPDNAYVDASHPWRTGIAYAYAPPQDLQPIRVLASEANGFYSVTRGRMVGVFLDVLVDSLHPLLELTILFLQ